MVDYYDQCHPDYENFWEIDKHLAMHFGFHDEAHRKHGDAMINMNRVLAEAVGIGPKDRVLDAGCGIGGSAIWLTENYGCSVIGINLSRKQVIMANRAAKQRGLAGMDQFYLADFNHTPFSPGSFDVIWGMESVCYSPDKCAFIKEAKRLLHSGGRLAITDGFVKDKRDNDDPDVLRCLNGWAVPHLAAIDEFCAWLHQAGFTEIVFRDVTRNIMPSVLALHRAGMANYPVCKLLEALKLRTKIQTGNVIGAIYQYNVLKRGICKYEILTACRN